MRNLIGRSALIGVLTAALAFGLTLIETSPATSENLITSGVQLSKNGALLWNFESLLKEKFGDRVPAASGYENFDCSGNECSPLSKYSPYFYTFTDLGHSSFRISTKGPSGMDFGAAPRPILIFGRLVFCSSGDSKFLVELSDASSFTLACYSPLAT